MKLWLLLGVLCLAASTNKVLILIGDFVEDSSVMVPMQLLQTLEVEVSTMCPGCRSGSNVTSSIRDYDRGCPPYTTYTERIGHHLNVSCDWSRLRPEEYSALILPDGRHWEYLLSHDSVLRVIKTFHEKKKVIGSIGYGLLPLVASGIAKDHSVTGDPSLRPLMEQTGSEFQSCKLDECIVDSHGKIVSTPSILGTSSMMREFLMMLNVSFNCDSSSSSDRRDL
jgi:protease I